MRLILASASPRRLALLRQIGLEPDAIRPTDIDESLRRGEMPRAYAARLAREKALALTPGADEVLLAADTVVAMGRRVLDKPADAAAARAHLMLMSGQRHSVLTAVVVRTSARLSERLVATTVRFKALSQQEIDGYLDGGEWQGKAGGYAIQGAAGAFVPWIGGSYSAIVGLPLTETAGLLRAAGIAPKATA